LPTDILIRPSDRADLLGFSDIVKIRNRVLDMKSRGANVLQLEGGEPFMNTPEFVKDAMKAALDANQTRYAASSGIPQLIDAIRAKLARKNGLEVTSDQVIVTSGGAHGLFCSFQTLVNPGDEVMFFAPYWTPIKDQVSFSGGVAVRVPWSEVRGRRDLTDVLESRRTDKLRVIYVNTPSNPTGDVLDREQLTSIAEFAKRNNLLVIADEAYEDLVYDGEHVSMASLPGMLERTLTVYTLSKSFAMTGWRVGYVVAAEPFMGVLRKLVLNTVNGVSTMSQFAAAAAVSSDPDYFTPIRSEYRKRRDTMVAALNQAGFRCLTPPGAFYLFADVSARLGNDSWKAMETLLEKTSIASVPGVVFGPEGEGCLRMSFSTSMVVIDSVVEALKRL
jgi:aspartate/methionine/tyrosine aminotransferase